MDLEILSDEALFERYGSLTELRNQRDTFDLESARDDLLGQLEIEIERRGYDPEKVAKFPYARV